MSRVIKPESAASMRNRLLRQVASVLHEGSSDQLSEQDLQDMVAFIVLALRQIIISIDQTTAAWEKRGYWLKADRFRMDWNWISLASQKLEAILEESRLHEAYQVLGELAGGMQGIQPRKSIGDRFWAGAWEQWANQNR
ncbi:MAG: hypothetical protein JXA97_08575 [Anaerolineales bacterium]|nr:hypothetical protein [Anaerolineales bacterium]